ncbi:MAG: antitoxin [Candidatus Tectomicrobia bacterium]|uniref:Antitoxin n=1 Tax=Tectimicrobiota bacterium TaxID=2528274 RepID=A0A932CMP9_UNCTE|nr:antitoxin [Candidatus Tectomicrobia bacterium]
MQTKLTLRIDENLVEFGKHWARTRGKSLSQLVADYLSFLTTLPKNEEELPPRTWGLLGIARGVDEEDYYRYLEEK